MKYGMLEFLIINKTKVSKREKNNSFLGLAISFNCFSEVRNFHYESGAILIEESYKNGNLEGITKNYSEDGQLMGRKNYKNGKIIGVWSRK